MPSFVFCPDMQQLFLVPVSVYNNKILNTESVTKREFPKYQVDQNPTYEIDSLEKEINKKLIAKTDTLVEKKLFFPRIKHSSWQTLTLDGAETGVLSDFAQQLRR